MKTLDATRFVVLGEGLAAGLTNFSLFDDDQRESFAAQMARQMKVDFPQPLFQSPGLGAARCELLKDVPGYFSADPHRDPDARHLPAIDFCEALAMADAGCDLVQRRALEAARASGVPLVIRALEGTSATVVG